MACSNCDRSRNCQFHTYRPLSTPLTYTKKFTVYDLKTKEVKQLDMREVDRTAGHYIEIDTKIATCVRCRNFVECSNYFVTSRNGSGNVNICRNCKLTRFANEEELFNYVRKKLSKRYDGNDSVLRNYLMQR